MKSFALHYSPPRAPVYFRFRSPGDRDAWAAEAPDYRRACPEPPPSPGWSEDRVSLEGGRVLPVSYRTATLEDLVPVSPAVGDPVSPAVEEVSAAGVKVAGLPAEYAPSEIRRYPQPMDLRRVDG